MFLLAFESTDAAEAAALNLRAMGAAARRLLADCVENQGVTRQKESKAAHMLDAAGFIFMRESVDYWPKIWTLTPALAGEEALEMLEIIEEKEAAAKLQNKH